MQLRLLSILVQFIKVSITYYNRYKAISQRTNFSQFGYFGHVYRLWQPSWISYFINL